MGLTRIGLLFTTLAVPAFSACAPARAPIADAPRAPLVTTSGTTEDLRDVLAASPFTVLVFFSRDCHCLSLHEGRLRAMYAEYRPRGVEFLMVDSEVGATPEGDAREAAKRAYPFPMVIDRGARLAEALDAQYATYTVVADRDGRVLFRGGIDSDRSHLHADTNPYLRDALDNLLAGKPPRRAEAKTLGCSLETR